VVISDLVHADCKAAIEIAERCHDSLLSPRGCMAPTFSPCTLVLGKTAAIVCTVGLQKWWIS
jgi:hypothetical protein